ncbi:MAG: hypothetical protein QOG20_5338 [Pseudonocardiales bacterium]|jgi:hypothetical protein|nr:hypothetical protein [Pseudonocardiales bacterium]
MKCGARVALGVAGGYFLGRTKKMKLALMLGGMAAGRQAGGPGQLLAQGSKLLSASPELSNLAEQVRGRLLEAGKGAALAVAAHQVEGLADRLGQRVESLGDIGADRKKSRREPPPDESDEYDQPDEDADKDVAAQDDDHVADDADQGEDEGEVEEAPPPRRTRTAASSSRTGGSGKATATATAKRLSPAAPGGARRTAGKATAGSQGRASRPRRSGNDG